MPDAEASFHREVTTREPVLSPVDRVSEMLFGLFMALTFIGAVSVADSGRSQIREMFIAALGCNLAWGLVDAVMYVVRTKTERTQHAPLEKARRRLVTRGEFTFEDFVKDLQRRRSVHELVAGRSAKAMEAKPDDAAGEPTAPR